VSSELYRQYSTLRGQVFRYMTDATDGPRIDRSSAVELSQKLLDHVLFVAFAGGTGLLPQNCWIRRRRPRMLFSP
jgi:hypothetical protein